MSKKNVAPVLQRVSPRQGEGHIVDVTLSSVGDGDLTSSIDMSQVPVPDRRFSADAAEIKVENSLVKLMFGQRHPIGGGLLALVVISMTFEAVHQFLESVGMDFQNGYRALAGQLPAEPLSNFTERADQTVVLNSSIVLVGYTGSIGCFDFYFASPFAIQQIATVRKLALEPVVRVNLPSQLLFGILDGLRERAALLPVLNLPSKPESKSHERV